MSWVTSDYLSLAAIIISILVPVSQIIYAKIFKRTKVTFFTFGKLIFYFDSYGSYMQVSFALQSENSDITIKRIELKVTNQNSKQELKMRWGYMFPISSKFADESTIGKRAHPVRINKDDIIPFIIDFYPVDNKGIEVNSIVKEYRKNVKYSDTHKKEIDPEYYSNFSNFIRKNFFWIGDNMYDLEVKVFCNKKIYSFNSHFNLSEDNERLLLSNVDKIMYRSGDYNTVIIENSSLN